VSLPSVLGLSFGSNLGPKLDFLQSSLRGADGNSLPLGDLRECVLSCPALLGYSLSERYR